MERNETREHTPSELHALLGPTNTGKTHRAIERMLEHASGMMGLPLRLLAREVYDRVSARVGEQAVALITGEEKRIPQRPSYFICTVEAMPRELEVDFLAVDEIQLIAHAERGHVFTDRLLHYRGRRETWFLGADTVAGLLREQLGLEQVGRLPRMSALRYAGQSSVRTLPRRSAVVAFSMQQVYELADLIRVRRGGAAVVLGALSPRVRNAQVAMYQAGEVDFLVATDAIGMGLNLDLEHVALAAQVKFDGRETRELETTEVAQIVGRAGRYLRDGTFGTLAPLPGLSPRVVEQLQTHRFPAQRFAYYRNSELDYSSLQSLLDSLLARPPHPSLRSAPESDDLALLGALRLRPALAARADTPERVSMLWDVCRIPNYEKRIPEHQAEHLSLLLSQLWEHGRVLPQLLEEQVRKLERYDGDIDVLLARLAAVRTWLYVSHQQAWVERAGHWQERTRGLEDRLGDLLHERLLTRFVSARTRHFPMHAQAPSAHHPFAKLASLGAGARTEVWTPARWVEALIGADTAQLELNERAEIWFGRERVGRLVRGKTLQAPGAKPMLPDWLEPGARSRAERRLQAHLKDLVAGVLAPLYPPERKQLLDQPESAALRGILYQLEQGLGSVPTRAVRAQLASLRRVDRRALGRWQIALGSQSVFARGLLLPEQLRARDALCHAWQPELAPSCAERSWQLRSEADRQLAMARGFVTLSRWAVRCDLLEELLARLAKLPREQAAERLECVRTCLACDDTQARAILDALPSSRRRKRRRKRAPRAQPDAEQLLSE